MCCFLSNVENERGGHERRGQGEEGEGDRPLNQSVILLNIILLNIGDVQGSPHQRTIEFICRMGIRIEKATNAITAPIITIISGSSSAVSAPMRTFTLDS